MTFFYSHVFAIGRHTFVCIDLILCIFMIKGIGFLRIEVVALSGKHLQAPQRDTLEF